MREGNVVGVIFVGRAIVQPFTDKQIELVTTFADQALIAIENARLFDEVQARTRDLSESLDQQTATADVLKVISRSTFDLQTVLDTLVESAARLCHADKANIARLKNDSFQFVAFSGFQPDYREYLKALQMSKVDRGSITGRTVLESRIVHIPDVLADPEFTWFEAQKRGNYRTVLGVPLLREGVPIGALFLSRATVDPFTQQQIDLVATFADQAVIAIENVRLFDEVQARTAELSEALERQTATSEVLQVISSSPGELEPVFQTMLANATRICGAEFGNMFLREGDTFRAVAVHGPPTSYVEWYRREPLFDPAELQNTPLARVAKSKEVLHILDLREDQSYVQQHPRIIALVESAGARTILGVPMLKEGELIGAIFIYRLEVRAFTDKEIELVTNFAAQAVIAIENTRLLSELRESLQQQTATSDVLSVISSSPGDLQPVFDAMLANAVRVCDAQVGILWRREGGGFRPGAIHGVPSNLIGEIRGRESRISDLGDLPRSFHLGQHRLWTRPPQCGHHARRGMARRCHRAAGRALVSRGTDAEGGRIDRCPSDFPSGGSAL